MRPQQPRLNQSPDLVTWAKLTAVSFHLCAVLLTIQAIAIVVAFKRSSNVNEYTVKNDRTRMRQNYIVQEATNNEVSDNADDLGVTYGSKSFEPDISPKELPDLLVDYANMIRNDILLLDQSSVQTRTTKGGNFEAEKRYEGFQEVPCTCEEDNKKVLFLGEDYVPRMLEMKICNEKLCPSPYSCKTRYYNVTVLRRRNNKDELAREFQEELPVELAMKWVALKKSIIVGCLCLKNYIEG
ncbi:prothoracicotropic hormone-like [Epargyreus clarus]|uniref:prothoracicotropic hormone-like n=1 Tax=Epargyreus clarus TaxID=520877 RepID=UPI003C2F9BEB